MPVKIVQKGNVSKQFQQKIHIFVFLDKSMCFVGLSLPFYTFHILGQGCSVLLTCTLNRIKVKNRSYSKRGTVGEKCLLLDRMIIKEVLWYLSLKSW